MDTKEESKPFLYDEYEDEYDDTYDDVEASRVEPVSNADTPDEVTFPFPTRNKKLN